MQHRMITTHTENILLKSMQDHIYRKKEIG